MAKAKLGNSQSDGSCKEALARAKYLSVAASKKSPLSAEVRSLPQRLALARKECGIASLKLDALAGVGGGRTSRIENEDRIDNLPLDTVIKIARPLGVRAAWLALGEEPMREAARPSSMPPSHPGSVGTARASFAESETQKMQKRSHGGRKG